VENARIADRLDEIADLIELEEGSRFRVRSFRGAARTVRSHSRPLEDMVGEGADLTELPSVGSSSAEAIAQIVETGTCDRLERLRSEVPSGTAELMRVPGLGPQRAMQIHRALGVDDLDELRDAAEAHRVRDLEGMGAKSEEKILDGLETLERTAGRMLAHDAADRLRRIGAHLDALDALDRWQVAGSLRRGRETVGDLDILVEASDRETALDAILDHDDIDEVISRGVERTSVRLESGLQIDFRFFEAKNFGAALLYFTGSKQHNIELRKRARKHDWKLSEYGLTKGDTVLAAHDEAAVYHRLGLAWIPPELREARGEIEAAENDELPALIEADDVRGDLHTHTNATDGTASIEDMAAAARERGYEYLAITDHSKRVSVAGGLDEKALRDHARRIRAIDDELDDLWLLAGVECDILKHGDLDLDLDLLAELDWVVASVHYDLGVGESKMTDRLVAAAESGVVHTIGHPTNRRIGSRDPVRFDLDTVVAACAENGVCLEINAQPERLDLPDTHVMAARHEGVRFTLGTDAHRPEGLDLMPGAIAVGRRGWLRARDVLNTLGPDDLRERMGRSGQ